MSRIGKKPIAIPDKVKVAVNQRKVTVEGPAGKLEQSFPAGVAIAVDEKAKVVTITREGDLKKVRAFHGMTRALINNMVNGVKTPFSKTLEIHGTGYQAETKGTVLELDIGFTNKVKMDVPKGIEVKVDGKARPVVVVISGADKQVVGQFSAEIRAIRPPSPYGENKGIRYRGEVIRKKAGKAFGEKK